MPSNVRFLWNHCRILHNLFVFVVSDGTQSERARETIREKCKHYLERAEKLKEYLKKGKDTGKKPVKDGAAPTK
jgi:vacuolar protein-sorting-associated protein 4